MLDVGRRARARWRSPLIVTVATWLLAVVAAGVSEAQAPAGSSGNGAAPQGQTIATQPAAADEAARRQGLRQFNLPGAADPAAPIAPSVITRGENGRVVVRATKLTTPLVIDGVLDEEVYTTVPSVGDFIQTVPNEGAPSTERTEAWITYDESNFYLSCKCWDSAPPEQWTANELRRDTNQLRQNDMFGAMIDTFHDRRNGFNFYTNPLAARADQIVTNEGNPNSDWNPVWFVRTGRFDGGWTVEMAIPFKSIRYVSGSDQVWGLQIRRAIRRKNEWTHLTFVPAATGGITSIFRASVAATLIGLDLPPAAKNIELKPYAISRLTSDRLRTPPLSNDWEPNAGLDLKYGINANLTADLTVNTDFAQVEVDEQQVNLTRFPVVFPEKREFFLEGRGTFEFGRSSGPPGFTGTVGIANNAPQLFFTRRVGLNNGREVPIMAGARVTGTVGKTAVALMNMETGYETTRDIERSACAAPYGTCTPATNFTAVRLRRDILRRSTIGVIFTNRSNSPANAESNQAYGVDANFSFFQNVTANAYYARSESPSRQGDQDSYQAKIDYDGDRYGARIDFLDVGANYYPEIGFVQRRGMARTFGSVRFSPRMRRGRRVRRMLFEPAAEYVVNRAGDIESSRWTGRFLTEFQTSDTITVDYQDNFELLLAPFQVSPGVNIRPGRYPFRNATMSYAFGQQRRASGTVAYQAGQFYDGTIHGLTLSGARVAILKQFSVEPSITVNNIDISAGSFVNTLIRARFDYAFTPLRFLSTLLQYDSANKTFSSNVRLRWEYQPGSEIFVVYTDERDTTVAGYPGLRNRAFVVKVNRLFRF
ncbi:MAG: carbohydrate binding family 9 domain-containing protein [Acidobacteria bacterium]|nr:carbohydrate binding family 9 domain-containing protein [Acidobacteriota bacterium]